MERELRACRNCGSWIS